MPKPVLELVDVSKIYTMGDQKLYALKDITLTIVEGEFVAVVGPSGCGKSTFLHVASLLDHASQGQIKIKGIATGEYSEKDRALLRNQYIGFVFQQFNLLPKTSALENASLPLVYGGVSREEQLRRAKEMLTTVGLGDRLKNTPAQLSGGQQQRVAIARALINKPAIIFADEPTGNLDSKSGEEIKKMIIHLNNEGKTAVLVTHDKELAKIAKRIVSMQDGEIVDDRLTKWGVADKKVYGKRLR